jgi:hypothetical protein
MATVLNRRVISMVPTVSVIVPVYNGGACFRRCLESLLATNPGICRDVLKKSALLQLRRSTSVGD